MQRRTNLAKYQGLEPWEGQMADNVEPQSLENKFIQKDYESKNTRAHGLYFKISLLAKFER